MRINDILTETQVQELEEGPILNKVGAGIGKVAGTVAKGIGAVAGGIAGIGGALKKGYQAGKSTVGGGGDDPAAQGAAPAAPAAPAAQGAAPAAAGGAMNAFKAGLQGKTTAQAAGQSASPEYTAAVDAVNKLSVGDKQNVLKLLQPGGAPTAAAPAPNAAAPAPNAAAPAPGGAPTPANVRAAKQATAGQAAQAQMKANPVAPKPAAVAPQTPDQIRAAKQATAGQAARDQMAAAPNAAPAAPASAEAPTAKAAPSFNNQIAGGKQTVSTGSKFNPATMKNTAGTPVGDKVQGGVPTTGKTPVQPTSAPTDTAPAAEPAVGDKVMGQMVQQLGKGNDYQATLDKNIAAQKAKQAPAANLAQEPAATPAGRTQGGGRVAGQLSQTPGAVKKRNARTFAADQERMATGTESVAYGMNESRSIFTK